MTHKYSQVLDSRWNTDFVYRAEVAKAPTIRGREVKAEVAPPIMNIIFSATLVIAASLRSTIGPDVDDFARVVSAQAQKPFNLAIQHVPELVLRMWKAGTDVEGHFIPGYRSTKLPRASVRTAENALQSVIARLNLEHDSELDVESQFIIPEENEEGRMETGLIMTWKINKKESINMPDEEPVKVVEDQGHHYCSAASPECGSRR